MKYFWHQTTLLRIAIPLIIGIILGFYLPAIPFIRWGSGILLLILLLVYFLFEHSWRYYINRFWVGFILNIGFLLAGIFLSVGENGNLLSRLKLPPAADYYSAELLDFPHKGENSVRLDLSIYAYTNDSVFIACKPTRIFAYTPPDSELDTLKPGDQVFFSALLSQKTEVLNPGQFDYSLYLRNKGIAASTYISTDVIVSRNENQRFQWFYMLKVIQNYCVNVFARFNIPEEELGVASALVLGKRTLIDPNLKNEYSEVGAVHILAVSGLHVGIIYIVIVAMLQRIFKAKKWRWLIFAISVFFLWSYAGITGFSPSVMRAASMFTFIALGKADNQRGSIYNMLAASAIVLLIWNPSILKEVGFQLSYLAVLGISYFYKPIYQLRVFKYWLPDKIWSLVVVAIAAQISTFPLSIYYFGQFPNYFLPTNIVVIPAAMIALYSGLLLLVFHWIPLVGSLFALVLEWDLWILNTIIQWVASLPMSVSDHLHFSIYAVIILYVFIMAGANLLRFPSRRNLIVVFGILVFLTGMWNYRKLTIANRAELSVLKGYRGDVICLQNGSSAYILLGDTSEKAIDRNRFYLDGFFDQKGIDKEIWIPFESDSSYSELHGRNGFFSFGMHRFSIPKNTEDWDIANDLLSDFILIGNEMNLKDSQFENREMIYVLSSNLVSWKREKLLGRLDSAGVRYWDLNSKGILSL